MSFPEPVASSHLQLPKSVAWKAGPHPGQMFNGAGRPWFFFSGCDCVSCKFLWRAHETTPPPKENT